MAWFADHPGRIFLISATLPLAAAVGLFLLGIVPRLRRIESGPQSILAGWFAVLTMATSAACSIIGSIWIFQDHEVLGRATILNRWTETMEFLRVGALQPDVRPALRIELGIAIDRLTALMMCMVTIISTLIFMFSVGYMRDELRRVHDHEIHLHRRGRFAGFFLYMLLFAFSMLQLIIADNLLQIFVCWELVGVCSFLLIGFYYERRSASTAANKAFIMNRVGDAGFLIALAIAFCTWGTFNIQELTTLSRNVGSESLWFYFGLGIFAGCVGKSAQFPLQTWLPDAMEGPTPVSALIHAATMVAAGVYLCARCLPFFTPEVREIVAWCGAITMVMSAATACVQTDIKRVLAFSTCSQLGLMMLALGLGGWDSGLFHLLTHAFFKALLFLCAGSVIVGLHHEQNLLRMGGLRRTMPVTAICMLIGVAAIIGVPLLSGWYSKDAILSMVYGHYAQGGSVILLALPFLTVVLTAYYMVRLWLLAFAGDSRSQMEAHESPSVMILPLLILAAFSIGIAWGWPIWDAHASQLFKLLHKESPIHQKSADTGHAVGLIAAAAMLIGVAVAIIRHRSGAFFRERGDALTRLLQNRFYFDRIYNVAFTRPTISLSTEIGRLDKNDADRSLDGVFTGAGTLVSGTGRLLAPLQSGQVRGYIAALGLTVAASLAILWGLYR